MIVNFSGLAFTLRRAVVVGLMVLLPGGLSRLGAQTPFMGMTFHHDPMVMNQYTIGEVGLGALTPAWWYQLFHPNYRFNALTTGKLEFRMGFNITLGKEEPYAVEIDSLLTDRSREEANNMLERMTDLAWAAERPKVEQAMSEFSDNISRITLSGGTMNEYHIWAERYNCLLTGLNAVRDAYQPNSLRQHTYLDIARQAKELNLQVVGFLEYLRARRQLEDYKSIGDLKGPDVGNIARGSIDTWKALALRVGFGGGH